MNGRHALASLARRWRLLCVRVAHPRARFGARCDVRTRLHLLVGGRQARVTFGEGCVLDRDLTVECRDHATIHVGNRTIFGHHCTVAAEQSVSIGEDCLIAEMVSIRDHDHRFDQRDIPIRQQGVTAAPVHIGSGVWLGAKVTVIKGVTIGDNAVIGANSVVVRDIPTNAVAVGSPARVIRVRDE